jgi:hypothetical protein
LRDSLDPLLLPRSEVLFLRFKSSLLLE